MKNNCKLMSLIMEMAKTLRFCQQDAVICEALTLHQYYILDLIAQKVRLKLSELHSLLLVEKSTTTRLVDPLVRHGLVVREKAEDDCRAINLRLTPKGEEAHRQVCRCMDGFVQSVEAHIPKAKRQEVYESVAVLLNAIKDACKKEWHQ